MQRRKTILVFATTLIVVYGVAIAPWPGLSAAYLAGFQATGRALFKTWGANGRIIFKAGAHSSGPWNSELILANVENKTAMQRIYETRQAYLATVFTLALVLATPIPWRRRWKAIVLAMLLIHLFLAARLWLGLLDGFSEERMAVVHLSPFWKEAVRLAVAIFLVSPEATFVAPVFAWIVAAVRSKDLTQWFGEAKVSADDAD